ncbi:hypothetical protein CHISP_0101 [Chitinispirillum alkaliphilum]|nr:hypothetical protein CHISP_0101 [Chitinispirillum alkaliphilum]
MILIFVAVMEPAFVFERFQLTDNEIPVLIDVSKSMGLFSPDSAVIPLLKQLNKPDEQSDVSFSFYSFGDSLRNVSDIEELEFSDSRSDFPLSFRRKNRNAEKLILITDGHWTNPRLPPDALSFSSVHYLRLPEARPRPFIDLNIETAKGTSFGNSMHVKADVNGFSGNKSNIALILREGDRVIEKKLLSTDSAGHYRAAADFHITDVEPGRTLYTIDAVHKEDQKEICISFLHHALPEQIKYQFFSPQPTLNRRFISQALTQRNIWRQSNQPDILFLTAWNNNAQNKLRRLPPYGVAVFLGALPCPYTRIDSPNNYRYTASPHLDIKSRITNNLPPPDALLVCSDAEALKMGQKLVSAIQDGSGDSIPLLFTGKTGETNSLFCAVKGMWKWDFWPLSIDRDEHEPFLFSHLVLESAKELLYNNISDSFLAYPPKPLYNSDSLKFNAVFPSSARPFTPASLTFHFSKNDLSVFDTLVSFSVPGNLEREFVLPELAEGEYMMRCTLQLDETQYAANQEIKVYQDISELRVTSQNSGFLEQFAVPLPGDPHLLSEQFSGSTTQGRTVQETFSIKRNWFILLMLFGLMASEWIIRRIVQLD